LPRFKLKLVLCPFVVEVCTCHLQGDYSDKIGEVLKSGLEGTARSRDAGFKVDKAARGLEEDVLGLEV
jgi:hypothetical protein